LLKAAFEEEINSFYENNGDVFKTIDDTHNTVGDGALFGRRYDQFNLKMRSYISDHFHKKAIIITSRVHPGEPQSSHMLQGMLDFLISDEAADLRRNFVFRIIPMLNIDGVIFGNQRCSLLGVDLNRRWVSPNVFLHPTIFYAKHLVRHMHNERRVLMYCDLHGHSRK
jgi:murein tripeptide amidase MpaA